MSFPLPITETLAAVLSALGVWLTARRQLVGWPVSLGATLLYGWVFFRAHLYADALLQGVFCVGILYGWVKWQQEGEAARQRTLTWPSALGGLALMLGLALLWSWGLAHTDDPLPFPDALLSSASLLGQYWMARRYRACWILWCVVDSAYVALFLERHLTLTAVLYAGFVGLAVYGWRSWGEKGR